MNYETANIKLGARESRKLGNNTYLQRRGADSIAVRLHATDVLTFHQDGRTVYNSGGWRTVTTKDRMNEYGGGVRIYSERGVWYVAQPPAWDRRVVFADGLTVDREGTITGGSPEPDERGDKRLIKRFVAHYISELEAGNVPAPGAGDCFYCGLREVGTNRPWGEAAGASGHIRTHFEEGYFVPSLLARAMEVFGASPALRQWVASFWDTSAPEDLRAQVRTGFYAYHGREACSRMLRRYLSRQLGYAA